MKPSPNTKIYVVLKAFQILSSGQRGTESQLSFLQDGSVDISCDVTAITKTTIKDRTYLLVCQNVAYRCRTNAHPFFVGFSFETFTDIYWRVTVPK